MKLILTHNNADFDAVASLLAMCKLQPKALPILPKRVNSNVRRFLLLYDRQWKLIPKDDSPRRVTIEQVYVVDTQKFEMARGMRDDTPVHIIDHHVHRTDLPDHYIITGDSTGANVTLLIEELIERHINVTSLEATLMMLGIYEDTGSLSYKNTTPRDIYAAAWLLEKGADLDLVRRYIRPEMSDAQANLLHRLQQSAAVLSIQGHDVLVTSAKSAEHIAEVALLASEFLKLYDVNAVILGIQVEQKVQLIARSRVDEIDLGSLMQQFGGNGHPRAAAALVKQSDLEATLKQLIDVLPRFTTPALQVETLMSYGVQSLDYQMSIGDAHDHILKTGHEGYPVLKDGKLWGRITSRAIERAMLHKMHKNSIDEVMELGDHSVTPQDSINTLRDKMLNTGWGQMPVVDDAGELIGIVTRTDLIKHWGERSGNQTDADETHIAAYQTILSDGVRALLETIAEHANQQEKGLYLVGGIVRDLLLQRPNLDIDLVVEGNAIDLAQSLHERFGGALHQHQQFGTAKWKITPDIIQQLGYEWVAEEYPDNIDFATSRAEFYEEPTALPTVREGSIKLDLHRRDFSINALALRLAPPPLGQLMDFYNGASDLDNGVIRVLHSLSFIDDPTRILRAVRFEQRFGFEIESRTLNLLKSALPLVERLSGDRVRHELDLIFTEGSWAADLERMGEIGILKAIHPSLEACSDHIIDYEAAQQVYANPPWALTTDWSIIIWGLLTYHVSDLDALTNRLRLPKTVSRQLKHVQLAYTQRAMLADATPSETVRQYEHLGEAAWMVTWLLATEAERAKMKALATTWQHIHPTRNGYDIQQMGLPPSPQIGELLWEVRAAWLDGKIQNPDDEQQYIRNRIQDLTRQ